jgi:hypothetical protein
MRTLTGSQPGALSFACDFLHTETTMIEKPHFTDSYTFVEALKPHLMRKNEACDYTSRSLLMFPQTFTSEVV